jgi:hypothetical protein
LISINDVEAWQHKNYLSVSVSKLLAVSEISLIPVVSKQEQPTLPNICYEIQQRSIQLHHCIRCLLLQKAYFYEFSFQLNFSRNEYTPTREAFRRSVLIADAGKERHTKPKEEL